MGNGERGIVGLEVRGVGKELRRVRLEVRRSQCEALGERGPDCDVPDVECDEVGTEGVGVFCIGGNMYAARVGSVRITCPGERAHILLKKIPS